MDLNINPFFLTKDGIDWVENTIESLTIEQKIAQLFCLSFYEYTDSFAQTLEKLPIGGFLFRTDALDKISGVINQLQKQSKIPYLTAANLETGGDGIVKEGTHYGYPMQVAATGKYDFAYKMGKVCGAEGALAGINWSFAPVVDIDRNFRNPITNLRTFGSDPGRVLEMASGYISGLEEEGLAACIKHFPGDGIDERDQHFVTSVNHLDCMEWDSSFGMVYSKLINQGVKTVMAGHIMLPAYSKKINPYLQDKDILPASLSPELLTGLLREKMGFNGVIITDASAMIGFMSAMKRELAVPTSIAAGCDMFLIAKNFKEDYDFMLEGYRNGIITPERLEDAVRRILALKASLGLHKRTEALPPVKCSEFDVHKNWAKSCAAHSITLIKDTQNFLPLGKDKTKKVYLNVFEENNKVDSPLRQELVKRFEKEGFEVFLRNREVNVNKSEFLIGAVDYGQLRPLFDELGASVKQFKQKYDLAVFVACYEVSNGHPDIRLSFRGISGMGDDCPWFLHEIPTMMISLGNPYHLFDAPAMKTYINTYSSSPTTIDALFEAIMGRADFVGESPVDPFCNVFGTNL